MGTRSKEAEGTYKSCNRCQIYRIRIRVVFPASNLFWLLFTGQITVQITPPHTQEQPNVIASQNYHQRCSSYKNEENKHY